MGYLDNKTEKAYFSHDKTMTTFEGCALSDMLIVVRNLKGGPPFCECASCPKPPPHPPTPAPDPPPPRVILNEWLDLRVGDAWPTRSLVKALDKPLDTVAGENPDQYVALWYMAGEPVMGRAWNEGGRIAARFGWCKREYKGNVGSIQLLCNLSEHVRGFDYSWVPYKKAAVFGEKAKTFSSVYVDNSKVSISPCVVNYK